MKTLTTLFIAALVCLTATTFAQDNKDVFEKAVLTKTAAGMPCVQLNWQNGSAGTAYSVVEKSVDGKTFEQVAIILTSDDANWTAYNYRDKSLSTAGTAVYYRIALVNGQKDITYLPVKKVDVFTAEATAKNTAPVAAKGGK